MEGFDPCVMGEIAFYIHKWPDIQCGPKSSTVGMGRGNFRWSGETHRHRKDSEMRRHHKDGDGFFAAAWMK